MAPIGSLVDPDALAPADDGDWDDLERPRISRTFLGVLLGSLDDSSWSSFAPARARVAA